MFIKMDEGAVQGEARLALLALSMKFWVCTEFGLDNANNTSLTPFSHNRPTKI
jgi:hypothetical protein